MDGNTTTDEVLAAAQARIEELERKIRGKRPAADNLCGCGCERRTTNRFAPGHDAKLKSTLIREFRTGDVHVRQSAWNRAEELGWTKFLTAAPTSGKEKRAALKAELEQLRKALDAAKAQIAAKA